MNKIRTRSRYSRADLVVDGLLAISIGGIAVMLYLLGSL